MTTYFVQVSFTIEAQDPEDANRRVAEYLDEASTCVIDPYGLEAVYVETERTKAYDPAAP